jgi:hypothetical protein
MTIDITPAKHRRDGISVIATSPKDSSGLKLSIRESARPAGWALPV